MSDTPIIDSLWEKSGRFMAYHDLLLETAKDLERQLAEARGDFATIAWNPGNNDDTGFTSGHIARAAIARIDGLAGAERRTLLDDERDVDAFPDLTRLDGDDELDETPDQDDDLDDPLPPKQCGLDDDEPCQSCQ